MPLPTRKAVWHETTAINMPLYPLGETEGFLVGRPQGNRHRVG